MPQVLASLHTTKNASIAGVQKLDHFLVHGYHNLATGPLLQASNIAIRGTEDFTSPELLIGMKLYEDCEYLDDLDGEVRDVVAADAWSIGAIIFHAATGSITHAENLRAAYIMRRHEQWKVATLPCPVNTLACCTGLHSRYLELSHSISNLSA